MKKLSKIVVLGGGNAMPRAVLAGLKQYPVKLSVICAMLDSGGSAGRLREFFNNSVSFGDIRRSIFVLSEADSETKEYFAYRDRDFGGHVIANITCSATAFATGSPEIAISRFAERLKVPSQHQVLPATLDNANIHAVLENGETIEGETNIDVPKHKGNLKIKNVYLKPEAKAYPKSLEAIKEADLIVIGPGDLYSSLSQILLVGGIPEAIRESRAKKVYLCNLMTKHGETNNFSVLDFVKEIEKYLAGEADYVIYNTSQPSPGILKRYKKEHRELLELVRIDENLLKNKFIGKDLLKKESIEHDPKEVAQAIISLL